MLRSTPLASRVFKALGSARHKSAKSVKSAESFLTSTTGQYFEHMYFKWREDPSSLPESWNAYFKSLGYEETAADEKLQPGLETVSSTSTQLGSDLSFLKRVLDVQGAIEAYQTRGHLIADTDPLGIQNPESAKLRDSTNLPPEIVLRGHLRGLTEAELNQEFPLGNLSFIDDKKTSLPLKEIIRRLNIVYCGHLGLEYAHINDATAVDWIRHKFETPGAWLLQPEHRKWIWMNVMRAVSLEAFLAKKYSSEKRFGLEGCESCIPLLNECIETSADYGVEVAAIGMAHRGRLNTLINVCSKPLHHLLALFKPIPLEGSGSGDVKYHLGALADRELERSGKKMEISIAANASHLESVNTMVLGRVRAEQIERNDGERGERSLCILMHGDAAFCGQGIAYETMNMTNLPDFKTGGVLHVVVNNQIGFTTSPSFSRSTPHCTNLGRVVDAPIFHVHADDPDLVVYCGRVAAEYRAIFHADVVLDLVGYRRYGHNEVDEPMLTQPIMYNVIKAHPNLLAVYSDKLLKEGIIDEAFVKEEIGKYEAHCEAEYQKASTIDSLNLSDWQEVRPTKFFPAPRPDKPLPSTGIAKEDVVKICDHVSTLPEDIRPHRTVNRMLKKRREYAAQGVFDWAMAESIAIASLLKEGHHVRLSGEDVQRGTFSHRLHLVHDQEREGLVHNVIDGIFPGQALYTVCNSPLTEYGVLGFELGYAMYNHNNLTIWEAQFGDFANCCQVIVDIALSSGETKWGRPVGLVVLLPHGLEGQGPEHSSARLERYLQLCDDDVGDCDEGAAPEIASAEQLSLVNWIVCNPTTPANLVHALRRQMIMPFRKPLVVMTPKSLLRHPMVLSSFVDVAPGSHFRALIPDEMSERKDVEKVIFCTGKVYYDLLTERSTKKLDGKIAILRVEQLCPFPYHLVKLELEKYPKSKIMWVQEEHRNQGAFQYVRERIAHALDIPLDEVSYGGRASSSSTATGNKLLYEKQQLDMLAAAMDLS